MPGAAWRALPHAPAVPPALAGVRVQALVDAVVPLGLVPSRPVRRTGSAGGYAVASLADARVQRVVTITARNGSHVEGVQVTARPRPDALALLGAVLGVALGPDAPDAAALADGLDAGSEGAVGPGGALLRLSRAPDGTDVAVLSPAATAPDPGGTWPLAATALEAFAERLELPPLEPGAWGAALRDGTLELTCAHDGAGAASALRLRRDVEGAVDEEELAALVADVLATADGGPPPPPGLVAEHLRGGLLQGSRVRGELSWDAGEGPTTVELLVTAR